MINQYLIHPSKNDEFFTEENCHILELHNNNSDAAFSIARARVEPGITTRWHHLVDTQEIYVITEGIGHMEVGSSPPFKVSKGDLVKIPKNTRQRIKNLSDNHDLLFYAICSPAFKKENYVELEKY